MKYCTSLNHVLNPINPCTTANGSSSLLNQLVSSSIYILPKLPQTCLKRLDMPPPILELSLTLTAPSVRPLVT